MTNIEIQRELGRLRREVLELRRRMPRPQVRTPAGGGGKGTPLHLIRIDSANGGEYSYTAMTTSDGETFAERTDGDGNPVTGKVYERNGWAAVWDYGAGGDKPFIVSATRHGSGGGAFMLFDMPMPPITASYQGVFLSGDGKLIADYVRMH